MAKTNIGSSSTGGNAKVRVATAAGLSPGYTRTGNTLTASSNGALGAIDGVTLSAGDRFLLKNGTSGADNGLYSLLTIGSGSSPWTAARTADADDSTKVVPGMTVVATEGSTLADTWFTLTTDAPITLNTTALTFSQFAGSGLYVPLTRTVSAGNGLTGGGDLSANRTFTVQAANASVSVSGSGVAVGTITTQVLTALSASNAAKDMGGGSITNVNLVDGVDVSTLSTATFSVDTGGTLPTSLVSYWPLREAGGTRLDAMGKMHLTEVAGEAVTSAAGKVGTAAAAFAGNTSSRLRCIDNPHIVSGATSFTIAGWAYLTNLSATRLLMGKTDGVSQRSWYLSYFQTNNTMLFYFAHDPAGITSASVESNAAAVSAATWFFFACGKNASANQIFVKINNASTKTAASSTAIQTVTSRLVLGGNDLAGSEHLGRLEQVGYWSKALSSTELTDLYNNGNGVSMTRRPPM